MSITRNPTAINQDNTNLRLMLGTLPKIRVLFDNGPNHGNQATSINLMKRVRELGFLGVFECVYPIEIKDRLLLLVNKIKNKSKIFTGSNCFSDADLNANFVDLETFKKARRENKVETLPIGITGAVDILPEDLFELNVNTFARYWPYTCGDKCNKKCDTQIFTQKTGLDSFVAIKDSCQQPLIFPQSQVTLIDIKNELENEIKTIQKQIRELKAKNAQKDGASLAKKHSLKQKQGLLRIINGILDKEFQFQPAYGWTIERNPANLFNLIASTRAAQLINGDNQPIVIGCFFNLLPKAIEVLASFVDNDHYGPLEDKVGSVNLRKEIMRLQLREVFNIGNINVDAIDKLDHLKQGKIKIVLITLDKLPKRIFDALFNFNNEISLAPWREGAASRSLLHATGRPHIRCSNGEHWDITTTHASPDLKNTLQRVNKKACLKVFDGGHNANVLEFMKTWRNEAVLPSKVVGQFVANASNPNSEVSIFFKQLQEVELENDRVAAGFIKILEMVPELQALVDAEKAKQIALQHDIISEDNHRDDQSDFFVPCDDTIDDCILKGVQTSSATQTKTYLSTVFSLFNSGYTYITSNLVNTPTLAVESTPVATQSPTFPMSASDGAAEVLPLRNLDFGELYAIGRFCSYYLQQMSPAFYILPWNRKLALSSETVANLNQQMIALQKLEKAYASQQNSRAARIAYFDEKFMYVATTLQQTRQAITQVLTTVEASKTDLRAISSALASIEKNINEISKLNRKELKKIGKKTKVVSYNPTTNTITRNNRLFCFQAANSSLQVNDDIMLATGSKPIRATK